MNYPHDYENRSRPLSPSANLLINDADDFDRDIRIGFVRKVLGIVLTQLSVTFSLAYMSSSNAEFAAVVLNPGT